jgi:hypothetical protein
MPFVKGDPRINRNGAPKNPIIKQFREALAQVEKEKNCPLLIHLLREAYKDHAVLMKVSDKMLPTLIESENLNIQEAGESVNELVRDIATRICRKNKVVEPGTGTGNQSPGMPNQT